MIHIDHATRVGVLRRPILVTLLFAARAVDWLLYHLSGGRTDSPVAWAVITYGCARRS